MGPLFDRRRFLGLMGGAAASLAFAQSAQDVPLGLQTWSVRKITGPDALERIIPIMQQSRLRTVELYGGHVEPQPSTAFAAPTSPAYHSAEQESARKEYAAQLRAWRMNTPLSHFQQIADLFSKKGIGILALSARPAGDTEELERLFVISQALRAPNISLRVPAEKTDAVASLAREHRLTVAIQSTDVATVLAQTKASPWLRWDLDVGDYAGENHADALDAVREHVTVLADVHLKDRRFDGKSMPFGEGDSKLPAIAQFVKKQRPDLPMLIDCDYGTGDNGDEVAASTRFVRDALK